MLYFHFLEQESDKRSQLWIRDEHKQLWPIFDYKIVGDSIHLISDKTSSVVESITLQELIDYVRWETCPALVPYVIVDEATGQNLEIKDRFYHKLIFEICN